MKLLYSALEEKMLPRGTISPDIILVDFLGRSTPAFCPTAGVQILGE
jgi:hypothetical protein